MATIKAYTDLEQSKKLEEILPIESADMWYQYTGISIKDGSKKPIYFPMVIRDCESDEDIPCWSLAALMNIIPKRIKDYNILRIDISNTTFAIWYDEIGYGLNNNLPDIAKESAVDACVNMIEKLHEQNIL